MEEKRDEMSQDEEVVKAESDGEMSRRLGEDEDMSKGMIGERNKGRLNGWVTWLGEVKGGDQNFGDP